MTIHASVLFFMPSVGSAGINGFLYGNLPGLSVCQGSQVHWHLFAMGNEVMLKFLLLHDFTATQLTFCRDAKCNLLSFEVSFSHLVKKIFGAVRWIHRQNLFLHVFMVVLCIYCCKSHGNDLLSKTLVGLKELVSWKVE